MDANTQLALTYFDLGWSVIPCHVPVRDGCSCGRDYCEWPGKHPRVNWTDYTSQRPERHQVFDWFEHEFYGSNMGIATGLVSGVAVVDVDHGALDEFISLKLPYTGLVALSGSGEGVHFYYRITKPIRSGKPKDNVDLKADGGFIVTAPSFHVSGNRYQWWKYGKLGELEPSMLPEPAPSRTDAGVGWFDELLAGVDEGERSVSLVRLAGRYSGLGLSENEAAIMLCAWNRESVHPPLPEREIGRAIRWAYKSRNESADIVSVDDIMQLLKGR